MSAIVATRARLDLGAVNEVVGYARTASRSVRVPDLGDERFRWRVDMHLHGVALDALYAALAFNDDLPWSAVHHRREEPGPAYSWVTLELPNVWLTLYSEHNPLDATPATTSVSAG
jgi:hypothetical protein